MVLVKNFVKNTKNNSIKYVLIYESQKKDDYFLISRFFSKKNNTKTQIIHNLVL